MGNTKICFISSGRLPSGDAGSLRLFSFAKYYVKKGFDVTMIGRGETPFKQILVKEGVKIISARKKRSDSFFHRLISFFGMYSRIMSCVKRYCFDSSVFFVPHDALPRRWMHSLFRFSKRHRALIVLNFVEFYSPSEFLFGGAFSTQYKRNVYLYKEKLPDNVRAIAISTYLEKLLRGRGTTVVRIPFVFDPAPSLLFQGRVNGEKKIFLYCGSPGRKDSIERMINGFLSLPNALKERIEVDFVGFSYRSIRLASPSLKRADDLPSFFRFFGKVPHEQIEAFYRRSDFSILLRPAKARFSLAGFPTKVVESLRFGVPPITNYTSDLPMYLKNCVNSVEVQGDDAKAFCEAVIKAFNIPDEQLLAMKNAAQETQRRSLTIDHYSDELLASVSLPLPSDVDR